MDVPKDLPHEPRFRFDSTEFEELIAEWRTIGRACLDSAEDYVRKHPTEAIALAFLAGTTLGSLFRSRR